MLENIPDIRYENTQIGDLKAEVKILEDGRKEAEFIRVGGRRCRPTNRFWNSLCARFGFGTTIFRYFDHEEVFARISDRSKKDQIRLAIQDKPGKDEYRPKNREEEPALLAVSDPSGKSSVTVEGLSEALEPLGNTLGVTYHGGLVVTQHRTRNEATWQIGPDTFNTYITLETPIDGYGKPTVYLSLLRSACSNGSVAYAKAFQSGIILGAKQSSSYTLQRALESFSNEDGFLALKQRLEVAQTSWASVHECVRLTRIFYTLSNASFKPTFALANVANGTESAEGNLRNRLLTKLHEMSGDIRALYGVAQLDSISDKRMRTLATKCKVYDLLNFATEVSTHQLLPQPARQVGVFFGDLVSKEYDLEQSGEVFAEFSDFVDPRSRFESRETSNV